MGGNGGRLYLKRPACPTPLDTVPPVRVVRVGFKRLLGFRDVAIEVDHDLQLIAGPNNAGKSTLVRLLEVFFSDPTPDAFASLKPMNDYYVAEGARSLSSITVDFGDLTATELEVFASIVRQRDQTFAVTLRFSRTGVISFEASKRPAADEARRLYEEILDRFHFVKIPSIRIADGAGGDDSLERLLDTLEAVLVRKGNARSTGLQQKFAELMGPVDALVGEVLDQSAAAIRDDLPFRENAVQFRLPDQRHALRGMLAAAVIESHGSVSLPVAQRGTGFQSALVLGILRYVAEEEAQSGGSLFFAIEEPEAFLHPQTQRAMAKVIRDIATDAQVLVTTHSSVVVDSFSIHQIARLPLQPQGLEFRWDCPSLEAATVGRLTRYCSAANSELVFANAVIFVEGESDHAVLERLLSRMCGGPGGHYALGITVIEASGVSKIRYLVELAELLGVRSYVVADRDSLHNTGGSRELIPIIQARSAGPDRATVAAIHAESDIESKTLTAAIERQKVLNQMLDPYDAFVFAADLEGMLLDMFGLDALVDHLGPDGHAAIDHAFATKLKSASDGREQLASWLGSKGWNSTGKKSGKLPPHLPGLLIDEWMDAKTRPGRVLQPLIDWLQAVVAGAGHSPV